jgi:hypothetical protein
MNPTVSPVDKREKNKRERERGGGENRERDKSFKKWEKGKEKKN